jgi:hypothetical protein
MRLAGPVSNKSNTYKMDAITNAVNALVEEKVWLVTQENKAHVERLKKEEINVRNARAAAVAWRIRCDEMADRAERAERALEELRAEREKPEQSEQPEVQLRENDEGETVAAVTQPLVTIYEGINKPTVSTAGRDIDMLVDYSYEEALAKAVELNCSVMVKKLHGNRWYLRAQDIPFETLKKSIDSLSKQKLKKGSATRIIHLIKH